ncbi:MAG: efflux RND transporter permease subunit, partial [Candidatus Eremiobacteraeota bacterium]|nr:efflux RND transporter permease subunit [Candidatus Eremiobacteraeota bacterium]
MARLKDKPAALQARPGETLKHLLSISHLAIAYPWPTIAFWAILSVAGVFAFLNLKLALFPDIAFPVVIVSVNTSQIDVTKNEATVTDPIEARLRRLQGVTRLHSLTYPQYVVIDLSFDVTQGLAARRAQVDAALGGLPLPAGSKLSIATEDLNETPVATFALTDPALSLAALAKIAQTQVAPEIRSIPGVLKVNVIGGVSTGEHAAAYRVDGQPAVAVAAIKSASTNTLDVAEASEERVAALATREPSLHIVRTSEQASYIKEATRATQEALAIAVVLAVFVIMAFLRDWRATAISAIAIPVSLLGTAIVMWVARFNLETITLLALALVVGVIVDDAIVEVENIVRHLEAGEDSMTSALYANKEIGLTLVAASLTIVAVFLPIGLMRGSLGQFFRSFGITASAAVIFSLLAARTLSPTIAAWWLRRRGGPGPREIDVASFVSHPHYRHTIAWALDHRRYVIGLAIFAFAAGLALIPFIPEGFIPHLDRGEFRVNFQTPLGTSLGDTEATAATLEDSVRADPAVTDAYTTIGERSGQANVGSIDVILNPKRRVKTVDVEDAVRARLPQLDGVVSTVADVPFIGTDTAKPLQFALIGRNPE